MSVVRGALILIVGFAAAVCVGVYVAARMPTMADPPAGKAILGGARLPDGTNAKDSIEEDASPWMRPPLETLCREKAEHLRRQLGHECHVAVRTPFVIAGDSSLDALGEIHSSIIEPAVRAMARLYLQRPPDRPITVLLFSNETTYRRYAELLFFDRNVSRFGYFKPGRRSIIVNLAWGDGPLFHELTHALMYFDFPRAAAWLQEGLASLHEASSLVAEGGLWTLEGKGNWRLDVLRRQIQAGSLPSLQNLIQTIEFEGEDEAIHCAQARYFCLFLQQKNVLAEVYRCYRTNHGEDPLGEKAVLGAFPGLTWQDLDAEFNRWMLSLSEDVVARKAGI